VRTRSTDEVDRSKRTETGLPSGEFSFMVNPVSVDELPIIIDREGIRKFCQERGIKKLSLFGSVLRKDFSPQSSDVDVLAEFAPGALKGLGFRFFKYAEELSAILGRKVDLCTRLNKYIAEEVQREAITIYEQA
jgi:predicted nucleotidyltransferase